SASPNCAAAMRLPATGVHRPISSRSAAPAAIRSSAAGTGDTAVGHPADINGMAAAVRRITRPAPGRPPGNVEKSLCTNALRSRYRGEDACARPGSRWARPLFRGGSCRLQVDDAAFQADRHGVRAIVRGEFGEDVLDVTFDRLFGDGEAGSDHLVG